MDSLTINCKISLSKKLRSMLNGRTSFALSGVIDAGRGDGQLTFTAESIVDMDVTDIGQTSIELTPTGIADEGPKNSVVGNIFSSIPTKQQLASEPVVRRLAAVHPPERHEVSTAVKGKVATPQAFADIEDPACQDYIQSTEQLISAINKAKATKRSNVNLDDITDPLDRALAQEQADLEEAIDSPAWVVQDQARSLVINDLKMEVSMNVPLNLGRISAKKLAASRELMGLIRAGILRFIAPEEVAGYVTKSEEIGEGHELPVYSSHDEAADAMGGGVTATPGRSVLIDEANAQDVTENDVGEEESMIINLTQGLPSRRSVPTRSSEAVPQRPRVSRHGAVQADPSRPKPAIRTVARKVE